MSDRPSRSKRRERQRGRGHRPARRGGGPRGLVLVALFVVAAAGVTYYLARRSPGPPPPPPAPSYRVADDGVRVAVFDVDALRAWCEERSLPDPPGVPEAESEFADALLDALRRAATERTADAFGQVGMIAESIDSHGSAREYFELAARANPLDYRWPYYLGCIDQITGRLDESARLFRRALEQEPRYPVTYARLGQIELDRGNLAAADSLFAAYSEMRPNDWLGLVGSGRVALQRGDAKAALALLREAVERGGDDFQVHRVLGQIHGALGDRKEAERHFERSRELPQGAWYRARDPLDEALHASASAVASLEAEFERQSASQDWEALARLAEEILRRRAEDVTMLGNLASLYRKLGRYGEAHDLLDRAFRIGTDALRLHLLRSEVALSENDFERSLAAAEAALALDPDSDRAHGIRARALLMLGRAGEAEGAMRRSLELQPADAGNRLVLGEILLNRGDLEGAERAFRAVLAQGENEHARQRLAQIGQIRTSEADSL